MPEGTFDYDAALRRLMELRFAARSRPDHEVGEEARRLERQIYRYAMSCRPRAQAERRAAENPAAQRWERED
ncbi:MAG TPA: hypothetical protein VE631_01455 [Alphaproteobacteria bacterium]|nr:hypothetical protein [Alphaproteobacteria bacterium]